MRKIKTSKKVKLFEQSFEKVVLHFEDGTSTEVDLMPKEVSVEATFMNVSLKADGSLQGKMRNQCTNHSALEFRKNHLVTATDSYLEKLETKNNNIEISDYASSAFHHSYHRYKEMQLDS